MKKLLKLDSFWLRIIALLTMTLDHIGACLDFNNSFILRLLGRLAIPLFIFLTVEGTLKTSNKKKYILRIGILAVVIGIALGVLAFLSSPFDQIGLSGNIFIDLLLVIISITILESPNKKIKWLIALPILYSIFSYVVIRLEGCGCDGIYYWFFPSLRMQVGWYGLLLGLGFYAAKKYARVFINKYIPINADDEEYEQALSNIFCTIVLIFAAICLMLANFAFGDKYAQQLDGIQTYAALAGIFILLYSGKKGYNAKWFKVAYYLYYPVHLVIIGLVFFIIGV